MKGWPAEWVGRTGLDEDRDCMEEEEYKIYVQTLSAVAGELIPFDFWSSEG